VRSLTLPFCEPTNQAFAPAAEWFLCRGNGDLAQPFPVSKAMCIRPCKAPLRREVHFSPPVLPPRRGSHLGWTAEPFSLEAQSRFFLFTGAYRALPSRFVIPSRMVSFFRPPLRHLVTAAVLSPSFFLGFFVWFGTVNQHAHALSW